MVTGITGQALAAKRKAKGLSQTDLATAAGISRTYLSQIERDDANISMSVLDRLMRALDIPSSPPLEAEPLSAPAVSVPSPGPTQPSDFIYYVMVALAQYLDQQRPYPYPEVLRQVLNWYAVKAIAAGRSVPLTFPDFLALCRRPLRAWWPESLDCLPAQIHPDMCLLIDSNLSELVVEIMSRLKLPAESSLAPSLQRVKAVVDQKAMLDLVVAAQANESMQSTYVKIRRFVVEHPWTTDRDLVQVFGFDGYRKVRAMYDEFAQYRDLAVQEGNMYHCPYCDGILNWVDNRFSCAKPSVCAMLKPSYFGKRRVPADPTVLRLNWGMHTRVCIPGKTELALYETLLDIKREHPMLASVALWPGGDIYDIQVRFADDVAWALDVKDFRDPAGLGRHLRGRAVENSLDPAIRWDEGFYVVPDYRLRETRGYIAQMKQAMAPIPLHTMILSESQMRKRIEQKIARLEDTADV